MKIKEKKKGELKIKQDFNEVVRENTNFVMSIVKKFVKNPESIKDLTQEIFIKAYLSYDHYVETGKIKSWLSVIANNKLKNYYKTEKYQNSNIAFSIDSMPDANIIENIYDDPEDMLIQKDFIKQIIDIINILPQKQRDAVYYSVIYNYSEKEIAEMKNIPVGSVKSAKHYGLEKVKNIILENNLITRKGSNMSNLNKKEAYTLLYQYAKGHISNEDKAAVEEYMKTDEESKNIMEALKELHSKLTYARDDETTHYNITFKLSNGGIICYSNVSYHMENHKEMNEYLEKYDGNTPPDGHWFEIGSNLNPALAVFDNEGNKMEINIFYPSESEKRYHRRNVKRMKKIFYPVHWCYDVYYTESSENPISYIKKSPLAANLYEAKTFNYFGNNTPVKSALYLALPGKSENIRMIRGNGVIDCGKYKFLYADKYVMGEDCIIAECTYNI